MDKQQLAALGRTLNAYASTHTSRGSLGQLSASPPAHEVTRPRVSEQYGEFYQQRAAAAWHSMRQSADKRIGLERYDRGQVEVFGR